LLTELTCFSLHTKNSGAVTGLVLITPASGYVDQTAAFVMGLMGTPIIYFGLKIKKWLGYDDALDAFGVHGVGGMVGGFFTGFFAHGWVSGVESKTGVFYGSPMGIQLGIQVYAIVVVAGWSFTISALLLFIIDKTLGLRVPGECVVLSSLFKPLK
jgi:Amt family ammonium transporter